MSGDLAGDSSPTYAVDKTRKTKKKKGSFPQNSEKPLPPNSAMAMYAVVDKTKKSRATPEKPLAGSNDDIPTYEVVTAEKMYCNIDDSAVYYSIATPRIADTDRNKKENPSKNKKQYRLMLICCLISILVAIALIVAASIVLIVLLVEFSHLRSDVALINSTLSSSATNTVNSSTTNAVISNLTRLDTNFQAFMNSINTEFSDLKSKVTTNVSQIGDRLDGFMLRKQVIELESITAANLTRLDDEVNNLLQDFYSNITSQLNAFMGLIITNVTETNRRTQQSIEDLKAILVDVANQTGIPIGRTFVSCAAIQQLSSSFPSGYYRVMSSNGSAITVYCDMTRSCGGITGGWMRVTLLDMRDTNTQCPSGFIEQSNSAQVRYCIRNTTAGGCSAIDYQTHGIMYSHVCGMIRGYQVRYPDAFINRHNLRPNPTIDSNYIDGVSLTHGISSKQHIWSLAASAICDCSTQIPSFVGNSFSCDGGVPYPQCPDLCTVLWDGEGCQSNNNSPWFYKQLPQSTTDDIEMRVCRDEVRSDEDIAIEIIEIFVQ